MKKTNGMTKLRNKMVISFLALTIITGILTSILDILPEILLPKIVNDGKLVALFAILFLALIILIYVASGFIFFLLTKKTIKKESDRQMQEKNLIYAAIAHDLKTPMTSVHGFAKALADGKIKPEEVDEIYDIIYRKSCSMNDMVDMLFEYSRLGTDEYKPEFSEIELCSFVRGIIAENYMDFEDHDINPIIDIPEDRILITGDSAELKRAITNLIVNIYKHNEDGISACISVHREGEKAVIRIADSGEPIPEGMDVFEPFVTENTSRTPGRGSGLGLAITKRIIDRHGGEVYVCKNEIVYTKAFVITL
ncbi:MAG: HAMP domain-containing histidine kinase [Eubacterium sp.]|nr:HAMP domain-containing histidine kinase [Eubacterium sp.]